MKRFFDMDNPIMRTLSAAADLLVLNLLTLLCSLPLFTLGPAMTALADGCMRIAEEETDTVAGDFFRVFRRGFRRSFPAGLALLAAALLLYFDYLAALAAVPQMRYAVAALSVLLLALAVYVFVLLAREGEGFLKTIKKAALLAVGFAPRTALMLLVWLGLWTLAFLFLRAAAPVLLMFGFSLPGYVCAVLMRPIIQTETIGSTKDQYIHKEE